MKREALSKSSGEALQLLVDPMCNFFAGLVFISVLVALFSKSQPGSPWREGEQGRTFANEELLAKRVTEVREETRSLQSQNRASAEKLGETPSLPSIDAVEKALADAVGDGEIGVGGLSSPETKARLDGAMTRERDRLRNRFEVFGNELAALGKETSRLQGRLDLFKKQGESPSGVREVKVRLPLAKTAAQNPFYIIVTGGKCYPLQFPSGKEDETHVERERTPGEDRILPRPNRGLAAGAMEKFFQQLDRNRQYPVLVVYADSFAEYQNLRSILEAMQQPYGWEPKAVGTPLRLSSQGFKPEVQ